LHREQKKLSSNETHFGKPVKSYNKILCIISAPEPAPLNIPIYIHSDGGCEVNRINNDNNNSYCARRYNIGGESSIPE